MSKSTLGELDIISTEPVLYNEHNPTIVPVIKSSVEVLRGLYGKTTLYFDNSRSSEYYLFIWRGERPYSLDVFYNCLSNKCRLIKNKYTIVMLLRVGVGYGSLQVSIFARNPGLIMVQDNLYHPLLTRLDALYEYMRLGGEISKGFGMMVDFNNNKLTPHSPQTAIERKILFDKFIRPFIIDIDKASAVYEKTLSLSLADKRKDAVRSHLSTLVAMGITMVKEENF